MTRELAHDLKITEQMKGLDVESKKILRHKEVLAVILKDTVSEYEGYSYEEIKDFIEADSISTETKVSPGMTNMVNKSGMNGGMATMVAGEKGEQKEFGENTASFDMLFRAKNPTLSTETIMVNLRVDVEPQKDYKPGYPIEKRGIYYLSRMISSQNVRIDNYTDYKQLEKCYSIWICRDNIPKEERNTISFYKFCNCRNIGRCIPNEENYDLMELVIIRLGEPEEECTQDVIEFLNLLFYPHKSDFKRKISRFIPGENEIMKEAEDMTGLGESIYAEGYEVGVSEGISQGINQGIEQNIRILRELNISEDVIKEKIMETFQISLKEAEKYLGR